MKINSFSVIVAVYNGAENLQRCIDSFVSQTFEQKEMIIIDGKSTDNTVNIIQKNALKIKHWESEKDRGIYHAFNKGLLHATGEWIIFLGCDDYFWSTSVLTNIAQNLVVNKVNARVIYGKVAIVSEENSVLQVMNKSWDRSKHNFLQFSNLYHQGIFHHCSLFSEYGIFDESFKVAGDYEFLLRDLKTNNAHFIENTIISGMKIGGVSSSPNNSLKIYKEFYVARNKNSVTSLPITLAWLYLTACFRLLILNVFGTKVSVQITDFYRSITGRNRIWTKL